MADLLTAPAQVDRVTLFTNLAQVTRQVTVDVPTAGRHQVVVPGMPLGLSTDGLRLAASDGQIGGINLAYGRLPVTPDDSSPQIASARTAVERAEAALRDRDAQIEMIGLRIAATQAQIDVLKSQAKAQTGLDPSAIQALAEMVGTQTLALRQQAFAAEQDRQAQHRARADDEQLLADAQQALDALIAPPIDRGVLRFDLTHDRAGRVTVDITALQTGAGWTPAYDLRLDTQGDSPQLRIDRAVVIAQQTGQDWQDVALILSTARPTQAIAPGTLWPQLRQIFPEGAFDTPQPIARSADVSMEMQAMAAPDSLPQVDDTGLTVRYSYPGRVDIRTGVEDLRLPLDSIQMPAQVWAQAIPALDQTAFLMAGFVNDSDEVLLPGRAVFHADGSMMGFGQMPLLAAGDQTEQGFGPLDGVRLTRSMPSRASGDRGLFGGTNQMTEQVVMQVENLTDRAWDIRLRDSVPYAEQEDLDIRITATPPITQRDIDGRRGILQWDFTLAPDETQSVTLDVTLRWPDGFMLR